MTKCLLFYLFIFYFFIYLFTLLLKTANRLTVMHIKSIPEILVWNYYLSGFVKWRWRLSIQLWLYKARLVIHYCYGNNIQTRSVLHLYIKILSWKCKGIHLNHFIMGNETLLCIAVKCIFASFQELLGSMCYKVMALSCIQYFIG